MGTIGASPKRAMRGAAATILRHRATLDTELGYHGSGSWDDNIHLPYDI